MSFELQLVLVLFIGFLLRIIPRFWIKYPTATDTYFHLYFAREIRRNRFKAPWSVPQVALNYGFQYPYFYHKILALFPPPILFKIEKYFSPILDTFQGLVLALFLLYLRNKGMLFLSDFKILACTLFLLFSPAYLRYGYGPRAYHLTPRVFGQLLLTAHVCSFFIWTVDRNMLYFFLSLLSFAFIMLSSNFTKQVLWFFSPFVISIYSLSYLYIIFLSLPLVMILSKGRFYFLCEAHIKYSIFYKNHLQKSYLYNTTFVNDFHNYLRKLKDKLFKYSPRDWFYLFRTNQYDSSLTMILKFIIKERFFIHQLLIYYHIYLVSFVIIFIWLINKSSYNLIFSKFLFAFILGSLFMYLLTSHKSFLFIGENERYLEHVLPISIIPFFSFYDSPIIFYLIILLYLIFYLVNVRLLISEEMELSDSIPLIAHTLSNLPDSDRRVLYPLGHYYWPALYFYKGNVLTSSALIIPNRNSVDLYMMVYANFPFPDNRLSKIVSFFNVFYIFVHKEDYDFYFTTYPELLDYFSKRFVLEKCFGPFLLYKSANY